LLATGEETASKEGSQEERAEALDGEDENRSKEQSSTGGQESVMDEVSEEKTENIDEEWQEALETQREAEADGKDGTEIEEKTAEPETEAAMDEQGEEKGTEENAAGDEEKKEDDAGEEEIENIDDMWQEALETQREAEALGDEERQAAPLDEKKKDAENTVSQPSEEKNIKTDGASGD
jgi:hypothetical protein